MKFFTVLLLASLASVSLAAIQESEDEISLETQPIDASAQSSPTSHPGKDSAPNSDLAAEPFILKEDISKDNVVIKSAGPNSQKPELLHPIIQNDSFENADIQLGKTAESNPSSATTSESELDNSVHEIKKDVDKAMKKIMGFLENIISAAKDAMKP